MNPIEQVALAWQALGRTFLELGRPRLWVPWLLFALVETGFLAALYWAPHPALSWIMAPVLRGLVGEEVLHYPTLIRQMPALFARLDLVAAALAAPLAFGASVVLFGSAFRGHPVGAGASLGRAGRRAIPLILTQLPVHLLVAAAGYLLAHVLRVRDGAGLRGFIFLAVITLVPVVVRAFFLYAGPLVMTEGRGVLDTLAELPRTWSRALWAALFLAFVLLLPLLVVPFACGQAAVQSSRFGPELVVLLLVGQIAVGATVWFLLAGSATLVHIAAVADNEGSDRW